jgi:hypothetical protein
VLTVMASVATATKEAISARYPSMVGECQDKP